MSMLIAFLLIVAISTLSGAMNHHDGLPWFASHRIPPSISPRRPPRPGPPVTAILALLARTGAVMGANYQAIFVVPFAFALVQAIITWRLPSTQEVAT